MKRKIQLPTQQYRGIAKLGSVDLEKRTIEVVFSTGYRGLRRTWGGDRYYEELSMDSSHVKLERLKSGASVLNSHNGWALRDVLGVVEDAWLEGTNGIARLSLSDDPEKAGVVNDILSGKIRNVSVGYNVRKFVEVGREDDVPIMRAEDWEPFEISFVSTGFDPYAQSRGADDTETLCDFITTERTSMTPEQIEAKRLADEKEALRLKDLQDAEIRAAVQRGIDQENARVRSISDLGTTHALKAETVKRMIDEKMDLERAHAFVLSEMAKDTESRKISPVTMSSEFNEKTHLIRGAEEAILTRVNSSVFTPTEASLKLRGSSLMDIMKDVLSMEGVLTRGMTPNEICKRGFHTTSDFGNIMSGTINKILSNAYNTAPVDYGFFTQSVGVSDYKQVGHYAMSQGPSLLEVKEHAEYKRGSVNTKEEYMQLKKFGRIFGVTREAIINDDLNALANWPRKWAFAAAQLKASLAYGVLTANPNMQDGNALFSTAHKNILAAGGTAVLNEANLGAAITLLEQQTGFGSDDGDIQYIGAQAKYLVVSPAQKFAALKLVTAVVPNQTSSVNLFSYLTVKSDPRITGTKWFVMADNAFHDSVAMLHLNGEEGPQLESLEGFNIDALEYKCRLDTGAKALDWKFAVYSPGA